MKIGIYGLSSQSGRAYFADLLGRGYDVIGYTRNSHHGAEVLSAIVAQGGIFLERPENMNHEQSRFIPLSGQSRVTDDLTAFVSDVDLVIITLPSIYHQESVEALKDANIVARNIPIILSPSRSVATPYLWQTLGPNYPIVCFSTCPYSCKAPKAGTAYIKRRKRTWLSSLEGHFTLEQVKLIQELFPQTSLSTVPALTSLNNIGAIFHCATYIMNYDRIVQYAAKGQPFSFYVDGIAHRPEVGDVLEEIDQVRLKIADRLGIQTFGLRENSRENVWARLIAGLRALESEHPDEIYELRKIRKSFIDYMNSCVFSAQHWLDITYGVERIEGESLSDAIGRTPTYQSNSVPQERYLTEDIPTGLVPLESLSRMFDIECGVLSRIIDKYDELSGGNIRETGRNLREFSKQYITDYLLGNLNRDGI